MAQIKDLRNRFQNSYDLISRVSGQVYQSSDKLTRTGSTIYQTREELHFSAKKIEEIKRKAQEDNLFIILCFYFLIAVAVFVVLRRLIYPSLYRDLIKLIWNCFFKFAEGLMALPGLIYGWSNAQRYIHSPIIWSLVQL